MYDDELLPLIRCDCRPGELGVVAEENVYIFRRTAGEPGAFPASGIHGVGVVGCLEYEA